MKYLLALTLIAATAFAGTPGVPEIDSNTAGTAIALIAGGLMVLRGRRRR